MKTRTLLATMLFVMASVTVKAQPMSYYAMRDNARFLTDRMAYTLGLTERLIDDLYMINYDYIYAVNDYLDDIAYGYHYDDYMAILAARDAAIRLLLTPYQWTRFITYDYFYRPIFFQNARCRALALCFARGCAKGTPPCRRTFARREFLRGNSAAFPLKCPFGTFPSKGKVRSLKLFRKK